MLAVQHVSDWTTHSRSVQNNFLGIIEMSKNSPLTFKVLSKCSRTKARRGLMMLRETKPVDTPGKISYENVIKIIPAHKISFFSIHASRNSRYPQRSFPRTTQAREHELSNYVVQHLPPRTATRNKNSGKSRRSSQVHELVSLSFYKFLYVV